MSLAQTPQRSRCINLRTFFTRAVPETLTRFSFIRCSGFVHEGVRRKFHWLGGEWVDDILLAVIYEEWEERRNQKTLTD